MFPNTGNPRSHLLTLTLCVGYRNCQVRHVLLFASSNWGIATSTVPFCPKLVEDCNFEAPVSCRDIGE